MKKEIKVTNAIERFLWQYKLAVSEGRNKDVVHIIIIDGYWFRLTWDEIKKRLENDERVRNFIRRRY